MSPDNRRMVFGGRARFTQVDATVSAPILHRYMTARFPQLRGVKVTHAWTGRQCRLHTRCIAAYGAS